MVELTEQLIKAKTKLEKLDDVKNLNLWGQALSNVSILQYMPNVEVLSLSVNQIPTLKDFRHCSKLQELYLRKNEVEHLSDVQYLAHLKELKVLWLCDNPCAEEQDYRMAVIKALPNLVKLDNQEITPHERAAAESAPDLPSFHKSELKEASTQGQIDQCFSGSGAPPAEDEPRSATATSSNPSPNILYAIFALIAELDVESLHLVKKEVEQRLGSKYDM